VSGQHVASVALICTMKSEAATELDHEWVPEPVEGAGVNNSCSCRESNFDFYKLISASSLR